MYWHNVGQGTEPRKSHLSFSSP